MCTYVILSLQQNLCPYLNLFWLTNHANRQTHTLMRPVLYLLLQKQKIKSKWKINLLSFPFFLAEAVPSDTQCYDGIVPNGISIIYIDGLGNCTQEKPWILQDIAEQPEQQVCHAGHWWRYLFMCNIVHIRRYNVNINPIEKFKITILHFFQTVIFSPKIPIAMPKPSASPIYSLHCNHLFITMFTSTCSTDCSNKIVKIQSGTWEIAIGSGLLNAVHKSSDH